MTDVKISQLPAATTPLAGTELVPIVQGGVTKKVAIGGTIPASQIINTPAGTVAATTVQAAINELDSEKVGFTTLAASSGSSLVGFLQSGTGAVATTVQTKLRESVSVLDFGADPTGVADSTAAIQAAITYSSSLTDHPTVYFPAGTYLLGPITTLKAPISGQDSFNTILKYNGVAGGTMITQNIVSGRHKKIENFQFVDGNNSCGCYINSTEYGTDWGSQLENIYFTHLVSASAECFVKTGWVINSYWKNIRFGCAPIGIKINQGTANSANRIFSIEDWTIDFSQASARMNAFIELDTGGASNCTVALKNARIESSNKLGNDAGTDKAALVRVINTTGSTITAATALRLELENMGTQISGTPTAYLIYHDTTELIYSALKATNTYTATTSYAGTYGGSWQTFYTRPQLPESADLFVYSGYFTDTKAVILPQYTFIANTLITNFSGSPEGQITATPGSIGFRTAGVVGGTFYLKETGSGNTGWVRIGSANRGTTAQRPSGLTVNEKGTLYLDNTLAANGKPIWWNGTIWVDSLGAAV